MKVWALMLVMPEAPSNPNLSAVPRLIFIASVVQALVLAM
jgi:hypothetical protein